MVAYVLQMLFFALSIFSVAIMFVMIFRNIKATKKQWYLLFLPMLLLIMTIAYRFPWETNTNNDLSRYIQDMKGLARYGFDYELHFADEFSWLWRVLSYMFCEIEDYSIFPMVTMGIEYLIFFYILADCADENGLSATDVGFCIILRITLLPIIISVSAARNTLAYSLFALGMYMYYKRGLKDWRVYVAMLAGVLTHTTVLLGVVIFLISVLFRKNKAVLLLLPLFGVLFAAVISPMLESSSSEYLQYFVDKWDSYIDAPNKYDGIKTDQMIIGFVPLLLLSAWWYLSKNQCPKKDRMLYVVGNMAVTMGVSTIMPSLFLRLCYPTSFLMPLLWSGMRQTGWHNRGTAMYFWLFMLIGVALFFIITGAGWIWQVYWVFQL